MVQQNSSADRLPIRAVRRIRRSLATRAERLLDRLGLVEPRPAAPAPVAPVVVAPVAVAPAVEAPVSPLAAPAVSAPSAPAAAGKMTFEAVEELFEDMVRPALQSDGGDITLREVVGGQVRVTLLGACSTCPSSIVTMKQGIERLLIDEFPDFESLVQVDG